MRTAVVGLTLAAALAHTAAAATFKVNYTVDAADSAPGDGLCRSALGFCTLRAAIQEANALPGADTIILGAATFPLSVRGQEEDAGVTGDLDVTDDLTIAGANQTATVIDGRRIDRVFKIHSAAHVTLSDLTVTNGEAPASRGEYPTELSGLYRDGGGIMNYGTLTLRNVTLSRNRAGRGEGSGGGMVNLGSATLQHVSFNSNRAGDGVPYRDHGESYFHFPGDVGGLWNLGSATLADVVFRANRAGDGTLTRGGPNDGGTEGGSIGAMWNDYDAAATLVDVSFILNRAGDGASDNGGGAEGGRAGGMENGGAATLRRVRFERNRAGHGGRAPGLESEAAPGGDGGGLTNFGTIDLSDVSIVGNRAGNAGVGNFGCGGNGGGMFNGSNARSVGGATLTNVLIARNRAGAGRPGCFGGYGGGLDNAAVATLTNVTITDNRAGNVAGYYPGLEGGFVGGGGGFNQGGSATLINVTIAFNRAGRRRFGSRPPSDPPSHAEQLSGNARLTNVLIAGAGESCSCDRYSGCPLSQGHNLDSGTTCGFTTAGDLSGVDPHLDVLRDNGGFTATMAVQTDSPAINAANDAACPGVDQRGVLRPQGAACDIGAYEFQF